MLRSGWSASHGIGGWNRAEYAPRRHYMPVPYSLISLKPIYLNLLYSLCSFFLLDIGNDQRQKILNSAEYHH
jgi:hypothetical protein